jgi:hypothetical protein
MSTPSGPVAGLAASTAGSTATRAFLVDERLSSGFADRRD